MFSFFRRSAATSDAWRTHLDSGVLLLRTLTEAERGRAIDIASTLVTTKNWEGCRGLTITDEIRAVISGQAALMLLGMDAYRFDEVRTILVYPGSFLAVREDPLGLDDELERILGQAIEDGPVIFSWWDARRAGKCLSDVNVVLHEFAHKLGELGNAEAGKPPIADPDLSRRWDAVAHREYRRLVADVDRGRPTLLDPYGAEDRCEFFAVAVECFFMRPKALRHLHADLYRLLADYFHQEPADRPGVELFVGDVKDARLEQARHIVDECTAALAHRYDFIDAVEERIDAYLDLGRFDDALADCATLQSLAEDDEARLEAILLRGDIHREAGRLDDAVADFSEVIARDRRHGPAWCSRGAAQARRGNLDEALSDLTRALRIDPEDDLALLERGTVHHRRGDLDRALKDISKAIDLSPYVASAHLCRARVHLDRGSAEEARSDVEAALRLAPGDVEALELRTKLETL